MSSSLKSRFAPVSGIALALVVAGPAGAQSTNYEAQVNSQVRSAEAAYAAVGYTRVLSTGSQTLPDDGRRSFDMNLAAGRSYSVFGACDKDCTDLDLKVFDPSGREVVSDTATDDIPTVSFTATQGGRWRLEVSMYQCNTSPCWYAASVVGGAGGAGAANFTSAPNTASGGGRSDYENQVRTQLDLVESTATGQGYSRLFRSPMMQLAEGATRDYSVTLIGGQPYMIAGVCDNDCPDMDIKLFDPSGAEVAADTATDSVPMVRHVPGKGGVYRVQAIMYDCNVAPCWAGVTVMAGSR